MKRKQEDQTEHNMPTKYLKQEIKVEIDFEDASKEWLKNKRKLENGCYEYKRTRSNKNN